MIKSTFPIIKLDSKGYMSYAMKIGLLEIRLPRDIIAPAGVIARALYQHETVLWNLPSFILASIVRRIYGTSRLHREHILISHMINLTVNTKNYGFSEEELVFNHARYIKFQYDQIFKDFSIKIIGELMKEYRQSANMWISKNRLRIYRYTENYKLENDNETL